MSKENLEEGLTEELKEALVEAEDIISNEEKEEENYDVDELINKIMNEDE